MPISALRGLSGANRPWSSAMGFLSEKLRTNNSVLAWLRGKNLISKSESTDFSIAAVTSQSAVSREVSAVQMILVGAGLDSIEGVKLCAEGSVIEGKILQKSPYSVTFRCSMGHSAHETWQVVAVGKGRAVKHSLNMSPYLFTNSNKEVVLKLAQ